MKKPATALLGLALALALTVSAHAAKTGFLGVGNYSESNASYGFETMGTEVVFNGEIVYNDYDEIYPGSTIYIPIHKQDEDWNTSHAGEKDIKSDKVEISHKALKNGKYIESVTIVDGKKEKITGLDSGAYAKIKVSDEYSSTGETIVDLKLVLSVNRISYQETEVNLAFGMENRKVLIDSSTVYGAQLPTLFEAASRFNGEVTFDMGGGIRYTAWVRQRTEYVVDYSPAVNEAISEMYPDGYLQFHNFRGDKDTFANTGKLELPIDKNKFKGTDGKPTVFAYQINGQNLTALGGDTVSYDSKTSILTIRTKTLGEYVLSSRSLMRQVEAGDDEAVLQTGYAAEQVPSQPQSQIPPQSQAPSTPQTPPTSLPTTPAPAPAPTGTGGINASNVSGNNPLTGENPCLPLAMTALLLGGATALAARRRKSDKNQEQ